MNSSAIEFEARERSVRGNEASATGAAPGPGLDPSDQRGVVSKGLVKRLEPNPCGTCFVKSCILQVFPSGRREGRNCHVGEEGLCRSISQK